MPDDNPQVMSYLAHRRALGLIGLGLPLALYLYGRVFGYGMQPSISEFYHSHMGDVLVGALVAIGVFLITYLGYPREKGELLSDQWVSTLAGAGALGVALFSVAPPGPDACPPGAAVSGPDGPVTCPIQGFVAHWDGLEWLHFASAALFFLSLAVFCLVLFPRGDLTAEGKIDWHAPKNRLYLGCGLALLLSILFLAGYAIAGAETKATLRRWNYVFWWETVGVIAFALSWLAKGKIVQGMRVLMSGRARPPD